MPKKFKVVPYLHPDAKEIIKLAKKENKNNLDNNSWWYICGELEEMLNYDKGVIINMSDFPQYQGDTLFWTKIVGDKTKIEKFIPKKEIKITGVIEVEVLGVPEDCIGYFWVTDERTIYAEDNDKNKTSFQNWRQHGLVCLKSDIKARKQAAISFGGKDRTI